MAKLGGELPEEVRELKERLEFNPGDVEARQRLGYGLVDAGQLRAGVAHLCLAAEIHAERQAFPAAIGLLNAVLEIDPDNARARRLLPTFYAKVPRTPSGAQRAVGPRGGEGDPLARDDEYGASLFSLPEESAAALAQLLPFADEDVDVPGGSVLVALPMPPENGAAKPLYASLDRELRRASRTGIEIPPLPPAGQTDDTAPYASVNVTRVKPAASVIGLDDLPPNQIVGLLDSDPLEALLKRVDALSIDGERLATVGARTGTRALYVIVRGAFDVRRRVGADRVSVDRLGPGDFFGEAELLTAGISDCEYFALDDSMLLELPARVVEEIASRRPEVRELLWDAYFTRSFQSMMGTSTLFAGIDAEVLSRIAVELEPLVFQAGDIILRSGEEPEGLYCVVGGSLAVVRSESEPPAIITRLAGGAFFGGLPDERVEAPRATIIATEGSTLLWLSPFAMASLLVSVPELGAALRVAERAAPWPYERIA